MKKSLIIKLKYFSSRLKKIKNYFLDSSVLSNTVLFCRLSKEYSKLFKIVCFFDRWKNLKKDILETKLLLNDYEMHDLAKDELKKLKLDILNVEKKIKCFFTKKHKFYKYGCFIEIRAGSGGNEASLFAMLLSKMYLKYAEFKKWDIEIVNSRINKYGGYKEVILKVCNTESYELLKFESGGHRVQRVPETESQGRLHTSTCTVAVIPNIPKYKFVKINIKDLRIETFKSSGAGGQHVNTTDSAVRIVHIPTGLVVECQDERSQHKNKSKAFEILNAKIFSLMKQKEKINKSILTKNLIGTGFRSDRIRTYNFPQSRVTDHRIFRSLYNLNSIINGNLDILINLLIENIEN